MVVESQWPKGFNDRRHIYLGLEEKVVQIKLGKCE